jgi:hypothetical protein
VTRIARAEFVDRNGEIAARAYQQRATSGHPEVACVRSLALVPATTVETMVMMPVTKPQHQVGTAIVWAVVVAVPMVAPTAMDGSATTEMTMPPATVRTPPAASMITVRFGDQTAFNDGTFA